MKSLKISHYLKYITALLFFGVMLVIGFSVYADTNLQYKAQGFAYGAISDNGDSVDAETGIGYLSFGCDDGGDSACEATETNNFPTGYGVRINTNPDSPDNGKIFGYAWSSNYGWVSFYHDDVASCGSRGGLEITGNVQEVINQQGWAQVLSGYARVLNYDPSEWNGCISFSGSTQSGSTYETKIGLLDSGNLGLKGWAWGGNVVGWISFSCETCDVQFIPVDEECSEADDPEICAPEGPQGGLALYVGPQNADPMAILGNSTYTIQTTDFDEPQTVKLIPQTFAVDVDTCTAIASGNQGALVNGWGGILTSLNPLSPDVISNQFIATVSNYQIGEIVTFTINCFTVDGDIPVSAQAFVTIQYPQGSVSISASPNPIDIILDPGGTTTLSWNFSNVQDNSCEITGVVDFTPADGTDSVTSMTAAFAESIGFSSWTPNNPGNDNLYGIVNFPVGFTITCDDYADQPLSDSVYITTTTLGCTESMEAAGWCSNDINPIFEEF